MPKIKFKASTQKERRCFAAECGRDSFGHTRALEGPSFDPGSKPLSLTRVKKLPVLEDKRCFAAECGPDPLGTQGPGWFGAGTQKERRCFAAECGPDFFGQARALEVRCGLERDGFRAKK